MVKIYDEVKADFVKDARKFIIRMAEYEPFAQNGDRRILDTMRHHFSAFIEILNEVQTEEVE